MKKRRLNRDRVLLLVFIGVFVLLVLLVFNIDLLFPPPEIELEQETRLVDMERFSGLELGTNPGAPVTIIEFSDFECPYCGQAYPIVKEMLAMYGDDVNFVYKHFPTHKNSGKIAEAAECARQQGYFWEYHDRIFESSGRSDEASLDGLASGTGIDLPMFRDCIISGKKNAVVQEHIKEAVLNGVKGTPTFFINGRVFQGAISLSVFKLAIDEELGESR